jgi:uncharacterized protein (TIGR03118 family)
MVRLTPTRARTGAGRTTLAAWGTAACAAALALAGSSLGAQSHFVQHNLVSDIPGLAPNLDSQLVNPWGISFSPTSFFWVSDNGTGVTTLYDGTGSKQALIVTIPGAAGSTGPSAPTGQVFNSAGAFGLSNGSNASFLFATEDGVISGWNGGAGTNAIRMVDLSAAGASYKGLAIAGSGATAQLFGADFGLGTVDVFDGSFTQQPGGTFLDPNLPAGYAPFNVQALGGSIYVTYALRDPTTGDDIAGAGHGFIDVFDTSGNLLRRLASGGVLNSPWGMAMAPAGFGLFAGALLVGNFGDGTINAFDPTTGALLGALSDPSGNPIVNDGLWALTFGNGGNGGSPGTLYFTAGLADETHGLFASLTVTPEPGTLGLAATGLVVLLAGVRRRRRA